MLSFVDYRRFGKWEINGEWGKDRGPDPISNYEVFFMKYKKVLYKFLINWDYHTLFSHLFLTMFTFQDFILPSLSLPNDGTRTPF